MSEKTQMLEAKRLINAKRYAAARRVLRAIDYYPQAALWLQKLDAIAPETKSRKPFYLFTAVVLLLALGAVLLIVNQMMVDGARLALTLTAP